MYDYQIDLNSEKVKLRCPRKSKPIDCEEISSQILMLIKSTLFNQLRQFLLTKKNMMVQMTIIYLKKK